MKTSIGKYSAGGMESHDRAGYCEVTIHFKNTDSRSVICDLDMSFGWNENVAQYAIDWQKATEIGGIYALDKARIKGGQVVIHKIKGAEVDVSPPIAATAAAFAVWNAVNYNPEDEVLEMMYQSIREYSINDVFKGF